MANNVHRYPGAQPFRDDDLSRRTFFGRDQAAVALTDQILANRLVVVYAKSGLGKTSLLNAGVAPRLREAGTVPLFVRVNDIQKGPAATVYEGIRAEAERQRVEYTAGDTSSLWSFFKSAEFWRNDLLLTPVLILDQFEELFTLQSDEARDSFLTELAYLIRGIAPPSYSQASPEATNTAPKLHVVLSLREDFLGILEEASDRIPEIMDHRFRLSPLTAEVAATAITGPAAIEDAKIATRPFTVDTQCVSLILAALTRSFAAGTGRGSRYVEPFHLQLICQRIENIVTVKQKLSGQEVVVTFKDLGGEQGLAQTMENFYSDAIRALPGRHLQGAVRVLCEQFLISPEGRRLSLEERELRRQLKLPAETLNQLVERRLLRTDRRSDSTYYELSHDALVQPVLASRRMQALALGWTGIIAGAITSLAGWGTLVICIALMFFGTKGDSSEKLGAAFIGILALFVGFLGRNWWRAGLRRQRRYRRHLPGEAADSLPTLQPIHNRLLGWAMVVFGSSSLIIWGATAIYLFVMLLALSFTHGTFPRWLAWTQDRIMLARWNEIHHHPFVQIPWNLLQLPTILLFSWILIRRGSIKLWPHRFLRRSQVARVPGLDRPPSILWAASKILLGCAFVYVAVVGFFALGKCASGWHGFVPHSFLEWIGPDIFGACRTLGTDHTDGWKTVTLFLFLAALFVLALPLLRRGLLDAYGWLRSSNLAHPERTHRQAVVGATCAVLVFGLLFYWTFSRPLFHLTIAMPRTAEAGALGVAHPVPLWTVGKSATIASTSNGTAWNVHQDSSKAAPALYTVRMATKDIGWTAGQDGLIWHTTDGFATKDVQTSNTQIDVSELDVVNSESVWAVGAKGTILHTEDAGRTWQLLRSGTSANLIDVTFVTPTSGWAVGWTGTILHTSDGGRTWSLQASGTDKRLAYVSFASPESGWIVGDNGIILHSDDGGRHWQHQQSNNALDLIGSTFISPQSGWVVGSAGTILHTDDGGQTWNSQNSGTTADLYEVVFNTPESGWAVGGKGTVLHTDDGGISWQARDIGTRADLFSIGYAHRYGIIGAQFNRARDMSGHPGAGGVILTGVSSGGPCEKAGLRDGDQIISVNDRPIGVGEDLIAAVSMLTPGTAAKVTYIRRGVQITTDVIVADGTQLVAAPQSPKK